MKICSCSTILIDFPFLQIFNKYSCHIFTNVSPTLPQIIDIYQCFISLPIYNFSSMCGISFASLFLPFYPTLLLFFLLSLLCTLLQSFLLIVQADWCCRNTNVHYTMYDIWYIWFIWATCKNKEQQLANPQTQILLLFLACLLCFPFPSSAAFIFLLPFLSSCTSCEYRKSKCMLYC